MSATQLASRLSRRLLFATSLVVATYPVQSDVFISEIHYDNAGADQNEAIEVTSTDINVSLDGWSLVLYNGNNGAEYQTVELSGFPVVAENCNENEGVLVVDVPGIQNGAPDGIALVDNSGVVQQFISYEGSLTATNGPAAGMLSVDIGVDEPSSSDANFSLQLGDNGWIGPLAHSFGQCTTSGGGDNGGGDTGGGDDGSKPVDLVKIHDIQGTGAEVVSRDVFQVEAIVVGDFQAASQLSGFFIQEEDSDVDADLASSEGIFVCCGQCPVDVMVGDKVQVTGQANEFFDMSQLNANSETDVTVIASGQPLPSAVDIILPVATLSNDLDTATDEINAFYEAYEGMLVRFPEELAVAEYFQLARFGEVTLSSGGRTRQFTDVSEPTESGFVAHQIDLAARRIVLDDDDNLQNSPLEDDSPLFYPQPGFSVDNRFRGGDTITGLTGVLHWSWAGFRDTNAWRIRPVVEAFDYQFTEVNARTEAPHEVGGTLKVASFNVLNYFTTLDEGENICSPNQNLGCRGADSEAELMRQTQKIVAAICALDADIVGLIELENLSIEGNQSAVESLVESINASCGTYEALKTGSLGTDAITVGLIYRPESASTVGEYAILDDDSFVNPRNAELPKNRAALAQTFMDMATGYELTVVVNHLKSKGSDCGEGDDDLLTGQGNCNLTRTLAAERQAEWLAEKPTGTDSEYVLVLGDLNAYRFEDPITAFKQAGYTDLSDALEGADSYGYVFNGQLGYLDYALSSEALTPFVTGVTHWNINADEPNVLDYNDDIQDASERSFEIKPSALPLFAADAYRSSDHDPVIVGIEFPGIPSGYAHLLNCLNGEALRKRFLLPNVFSDELDETSDYFDWELSDAGDGYVYIKNRKGINAYLRQSLISNKVATAPLPLVREPLNFQWKIERSGDGVIHLQNRQSGQYLRLNGRANGIVVSELTDAPAFDWRFGQ